MKLTVHWSTMSLARFLTTTILCGAFWACCSPFNPRFKPPATQRTVNAYTSLVTATTSLVTANTPSMTATTSLVTANTPSMTATTSSVTTNTPSMTATTSSMTANTPSMTATTSSVTTNTPSMTATTSSMTANTPSMTATTSSVTTNTPSMTATTSSVTANTPSMTANTPPVTTTNHSVIANTPLVTVDTPSVTASTPSTTAKTNPVTADTHNATADTPSVTSNTHPVTPNWFGPHATNKPPVTANTPSVTANTHPVTPNWFGPYATNKPPVTANRPSVTANTHPVTPNWFGPHATNKPLVTANTPPVTANTHPVTPNWFGPHATNKPLVTANTPLVTANTHPVTPNWFGPHATNKPPVAANTPTVTANTHPVTPNWFGPHATNKPPVTTYTHPVTPNWFGPHATNKPPVTANTPLVTANTHPVTPNWFGPHATNKPPVTANTPTVTANTHPVTPNWFGPHATNKPPVTANTHPVTPNWFGPHATNKPPVTANTPLVTANTHPVTPNWWGSHATNKPPVTANTPAVTADPPPVTFNQLRGLRTYMDGERIVFEVTAQLLTDCVAGQAEKDPDKLLALQRRADIYLNNDSTSHIKRGTLKMDVRRSDNVTLTPASSTEELVNRCTIAIHTEFRVKKTIKVLEFAISSGDSFQVDVLSKGKQAETPVRYASSLERPQRVVFVERVALTVEWRTLPKAVVMEMDYMDREPSRVFFTWPVTMTSPMKGFMRTVYWDGLTALRGLEYFFDIGGGYYYGELEGPSGLHKMISWEDIGTGDSTTCSNIHVVLEKGLLGLGEKTIYCGGSSPAPFLVDAHRRITTFIRSHLMSDKNGYVYTGASMRFSFHNASAGLLPQQLADKTWNCSVAHWSDFKEHLLCNLVTECAGGEDEADCPYTPRSGATCPQGYLEAGGGCFTFDPLPDKALTSWAEAQAACRRRGARLPTLNTPAKWQAVVDLLGHRSWDTIYIGLTSGHSSLPDLYNRFLQWTDTSVPYYLKGAYNLGSHCGLCAFLKKTRRPGFVYMDSCVRRVAGNLMCQAPETRAHRTAIALNAGNTAHSRINSSRCPKGHVTHNFLSCDPRTDCWDSCYTTSSAPSQSFPPAFRCHNGFEHVPFTLLCDHREDCSDVSDEICVFPSCQEFECNNKQCTTHRQTCDGVKDCLDGSDEIVCNRTFDSSSILNFSKPLPAMVLHDGKGLYDLLDLTDPSTQSTSSDNQSTAVEGCPDSHFQCPGVSYYCLPVYVRCNGVYDCPDGQDEADCKDSECPGFYRCRRSKVCLHSDHVCDGIFQCPQRDDELMCGFVCPVGCTCYGLAFFCQFSFDASRHAGLRFLDASGSGMSLKGLSNNAMLFYLKLARCNVTQLETMSFPNLFHLDLSENTITTLEEKHISALQNLQAFVVTGNPLRTILEASSSGRVALLPKLRTLELSAVSITAAQMVNLHVFPNVINLNLSNTRLDAVAPFSVFSQLRVLDLRGCPVTYFPRSVFQGLDDLSTVYADNYKLCCPVTLPNDFNVRNCHAPFDEVSSCEGLLKSGLYRVGLSVLTSMTLMGNAGSFVYRVFISRPKQQSSFSLFVTNLCLSDFMMGLYSAIIGVADRLYVGNYVWNDVTWRTTVTCKMAGVLSLVSNEVSVLIICLITVDRFLVTRFPFSLHLHFSPRSARVACVATWVIGVLLAVTPLLPVTSHWQLYSQTGLCIPLPVTRRWFAGRDYSFGILVILNFLLFLVIASGQMLIYLSIRANSMITSDTTQKAKDLTIARRLITVAVSDFLCWFPVGLLGMMSSRGHTIPGEAGVVIAVFVLPLNSALNPFLYTVNVILERRQRVREQRLLKIMLARHGVSTAKREGEESKEAMQAC